MIEVRATPCSWRPTGTSWCPTCRELPPSIAKKGAVPSIEAVFRSGLGRQEEQALPAEIVAADLTDEYGDDLAFLRVRGVKKPPKPINPLTRFDPTEGMTYIGAGFPLGGSLNKISESKGNPSVTITGGRIAALRRDEHGHITLLQVDGSLQPGNSGGPIVEEKTGKLLGVAVASLSRAGIDTIGFIVPAAELRRALAGRVGALDLTLQQSPQGTADLSGQGPGRRPQAEWSRGSWSTSPRPPPSARSIPTRRVLAAAAQQHARRAQEGRQDRQR